MLNESIGGGYAREAINTEKGLIKSVGEPEKTVVKSEKGGGKADKSSGRAGK